MRRLIIMMVMCMGFLLVASTAAYADLFEGTSGADNLTGTSADDSMYGYAGADQISGAGGYDILNGNFGNDILIGQGADDVSRGHDGSDHIQANNADEVDCGNGEDFLYKASTWTAPFGVPANCEHVKSMATINMPSFPIQDPDADLYPNDGAFADNCPNIPNNNQADANANGVGDACETTDTTAPDTTITGGPAGGSTDTDGDVSFTFTSSESNSTFQCKLDGDDYSSCTSPQNFSALSDGSHTFSVKAKDASGNEDATPATRTFSVQRPAVDSTPPVVSINSGPGDTSTGTATFSFSADESANFECQLEKADGTVVSAFSSCSTGKSFSNLQNGSYTFSVKGTDPSGNVSNPVTNNFTVTLTTPPVGSATIVGAGDIGETGTGAKAIVKASGDLVRQQIAAGAVNAFTLGDNAYESGNLAEYNSNYDINGTGWGSFIGKTLPTFGNHDYYNGNNTAQGAASYWGSRTAATVSTVNNNNSYYVKAIPNTNWRVMVLNSENTELPNTNSAPSCAVGSAQYNFALNEMQADQPNGSHPSNLMITYHHPRFTNGNTHDSAEGSTGCSRTFWDMAYDNGVDLVMNGHSHNWERFDTRNKSGSKVSGGLTEVVAGVGGAGFDSFQSSNPPADKQLVNKHGIAKIVLNPDNAEVSFLPIAGETGTDYAKVAVRNPGNNPPPADTTAPDTNITAGPAENSTDTDGEVSFSFSATESGSSFECSADSAPFEACTSPKVYTGLTNGAHSVSFRATDTAGNTDQTPVTRNFIVDTTTPPPVPGADADGDGMADSEDACDDLANIAGTNNGCPYAQSVDYDFDGIKDANDTITGLEQGNPDYGVSTNSRIRAHCEVYATNQVDPIAHALHIHRQFGNTTTSNDSTGQSLYAAGRGKTSCDQAWLTNGGWFPVEADGDNPSNTFKSINGVDVYYRAYDDERLVQELPVGIQLLTPDQKYSDNGSNFQDTPPYGTTSNNWSTRNIFHDCVDLRHLNDQETNSVDSDSNSRCPASHPYRIPQINQLVIHPSPVPKPLVVSMGASEWGDYTMMHGDYYTAPQDEFNETTSFGPSLVQFCLRDGNGDQNGPVRCGVRG